MRIIKLRGVSFPLKTQSIADYNFNSEVLPKKDESILLKHNIEQLKEKLKWVRHR